MAAGNYIPNEETLLKARGKGAFILVIQGNYDNGVYEKFESWAQKKGLTYVNQVGIYHDAKLDSFKFMAHWIVKKAPAIDLILAYAKSHPGLRMAIYL